MSFFQDTNLSAPTKNCFLSSDTTADKTLSVHSHTCSGGFGLNHKVLSGTLYSLKLSVILKTFNSSVIYDNTMICFIRGRGRAGPALFRFWQTDSDNSKNTCSPVSSVIKRKEKFSFKINTNDFV